MEDGTFHDHCAFVKGQVWAMWVYDEEQLNAQNEEGEVGAEEKTEPKKEK